MAIKTQPTINAQKQVARLINAASKVLTEDEQTAAISYLAEGTNDPKVRSSLLNAASHSVRARIEQQDNVQDQIVQKIRGYEQLCIDLSSLYHNYSNLELGSFGKVANIQIYDMRNRSGYESRKHVDLKYVNYLLGGSFRPINQLNTDNPSLLLGLTALTLRSLESYTLQGYGKEMSLEDLKGDNPQLNTYKGYSSEKYDKQLSEILQRAKEIVGLEPFPENIK